MKEKYVVIMVHNFDPEVKTAEFDNYDMAKAYLHWLWEDYYNEEIAVGSELNEEFCYHQDEYAIVEWLDGDRVEFMLSAVEEPYDGFKHIDWKRYL